MPSQEEEFLIEGLLAPGEVGNICLADLLALLRVADASEQVGDLVGVHARGGHLDGTRPVEIVVAQRKGKLLELNLGEATVLKWHEEVGRLHASLATLYRDQVEIELASLIGRVRIFH